MKANYEEPIPIVAASNSSEGTLSCLISLLLPINNLLVMIVSLVFCIRKDRVAIIPNSHASVNACFSNFLE